MNAVDVSITRTDVDGVPVFHPTRALDEHLSGALTFRVGMCDEELPAHGITHLIEHLTLFPLRHAPVSFNGFTGLTTTSFVAQGRPDDAARHLTSVSQSLASLPYDRLETEARVLRAEAAQRSPTISTAAFGVRFGAQRYGLVAHEELGLHHPSSEHLDAWRAYFMTRQNAAVWLNAPPPPELDLSALPDGAHRAVPAAIPLPQLFPARFFLNSAGLSVSMLGERAPVNEAALSLLSTIMHERLRDEAGLSYQVGLQCEALSNSVVHWMLGADCRPEDTSAVLGEMHAVLAKIRVDGIDEAQLTRFLDLLQRPGTTRNELLGDVVSHADDHLHGARHRTIEQRRSDAAHLTAATLEQAMTGLLSTALWMVPHGVVLDDGRLADVPAWSTRHVAGTEYTPVQPAAPDEPVERLTVGVEGLSWSGRRGGGEALLSVLWGSVSAAVRHPDGWRVVGNDGFSVTVLDDAWNHGNQIAATIASQVPPERIVRSGDPLVATGTR